MPGPAPRWPPGVVPLVALGGFVGGGLVAYVPAARGVAILAPLHKLGVLLFRSTFGLQVVMALGALAHVVEAVLTVPIAKRRGCSTSQALGWALLTLLVGYPSIMTLKADAQKLKAKGA